MEETTKAEEETMTDAATKLAHKVMLEWQRAIQALETSKALKYPEPQISAILSNAAEREVELKAAIDAAVKAAEERGEIRGTQQRIDIMVEEVAAEMRERAAVIASKGDMTAFIVDAIRALPLHKEADDSDDENPQTLGDA